MKNRILSGLGVSSLAWEPEDDREIARLLESRGVTFIDFVPTKYFQWGHEDALQKASRIRQEWADSGVNIRGMQSLLFGAGPLNILNTEDWPALRAHFEKVFPIASALGVDRMVFGSPHNRKKGSMNQIEAEDTAEQFFRALADQARGHSCVVMLEPNPMDYGCDFVTTTHEAVSLVQRVSHPNLKVQLDLGTCFINNEQAGTIFEEFCESIGYVHLATKNLVALAEIPNPEILSFLGALHEGAPMSIEIKSSRKVSNVFQVQESLDWIEQALAGLHKQAGE